MRFVYLKKITKNEQCTSLATNSSSCRSESKLNLQSVKRKRNRMETSTPIAARRESQQIELGEESPIGGEGSNSLETPDISDERIQDS